MEVPMARLRQGEKDRNERSIHNLLQRCQNGLTEQEISEMTGMDRRRLNNYLRELQDDQKAYRDKRLWFADR
jgi:predicted transcriptional regulator